VIVLLLALGTRHAQAWDCPEEPLPGELLLQTDGRVSANANLWLEKNDESPAGMMKAYRLSAPGGKTIALAAAKCWDSWRWEVSETTDLPGYEYEWTSNDPRTLCRLTPKSALKPDTEYALDGVVARDDGGEVHGRRVVHFRTSGTSSDRGPRVDGQASATVFLMYEKIPGSGLSGPNSDPATDTKPILKIHLPRIIGHASPPLFAIWFGDAQGEPQWIVRGSDESIGIGVIGGCSYSGRPPTLPKGWLSIPAISLRPMDLAGRFGDSIRVPIAKRKQPLKIFLHWG
jgi:hypothetical protein